jgi:mRNA-degrading endonuclease toxin of MazEF toxin-antitoxin module
MGSMGAAISRAISSAGIFAGQVWRIPDALLTFADAVPGKRRLHSNRPVIVLQGDDHGANAQCPTVLVVLLSSNVNNQRPWEDRIIGTETPLPEPSIVKLHLIQPINRQVLLDNGQYVGDVSPEAMDRIFVHLVTNLGLLPAEDAL